MSEDVRLGDGMLLSGQAFGGETVRADTVPAVIELVGRDLGGAVLVTDEASATSYAPVLPGLGGVICTAGGEAAHLAIVCRGLGIPCVMRAGLDRAPSPGEPIRVDAEGTIWVRRR